MTQQEELMEGLKGEGFRDIQVHSFGPGTDFPSHTHDKLTAHIILSGELDIEDASGRRTVRQGDRFDVSAGTTHSARCGPEGCSFIAGER